jgi:hypothetical protein
MNGALTTGFASQPDALISENILGFVLRKLLLATEIILNRIVYSQNRTMQCQSHPISIKLLRLCPRLNHCH